MATVTYDSKVCNRCGLPKPLSDFHRDNQRPDGRRSLCKDCTCERRGLYYRHNRDAELARNRARVMDGRAAEAQQRYRERHPGLATARHREWRESLRKKIFAHYGEQCACCGSTERLTIDHRYGGGGKERNLLFGASHRGGWVFYAWLVRNGFPAGYQTLCLWCNRSKGSYDRCSLQHEGG